MRRSSSLAPPVTETREFWVLIAYAAALGVFGAVVALAFLGVIGVGNNWFSSSDSGWFGGNWWWVAVTVAAGVAVGLLPCDASARQDPQPDRRPAGGVRRPRLVPGSSPSPRVADRWCEVSA